MSLNFKETMRTVAKLGTLPFFPSDEDSRIAIAETFAAMAKTSDQVLWTVNRCRQLWNKWESEHELRAVFCSRYSPADGIDTYSRLPQFEDGIPSESESRNQELLGANEPKRLESGPATTMLAEAVKVAPVVPVLVKRPPLPSEAEIEALRRTQDSNRRGDDAVRELAQQLGIREANRG